MVGTREIELSEVAYDRRGLDKGYFLYLEFFWTVVLDRVELVGSPSVVVNGYSNSEDSEGFSVVRIW